MNTASKTASPTLRSIASRLANDPAALQTVRTSTAQFHVGQVKSIEEARQILAIKRAKRAKMGVSAEREPEIAQANG